MLEQIVDFYRHLNRKDFLEEQYKDYADYDDPLPIGHGQTISQPTLVMEMTMVLDLDKTQKVLEIGTGSGYQTAFLAEFSQSVFTVELIEELSLKAQKRIQKLGYQNIQFKIGDGSFGWADNAPYDRIIVTAAAGKIPYALVEQLRAGGKMLLPVGERGVQELVLITKNENGDVHKEVLSLVRFVELVGEYGWQ